MFLIRILLFPFAVLYDGATTVTDHLQQGREAYWRRAWAEAFETLSQRDEERPLAADDLWLLASSIQA